MSLLLICLGLGQSFIIQAASTPMLLSHALKKKFVTVNAVGTGGYKGKCISLQMVNNTDVDLSLTIDNALIFQPADTSYQNLVVVGDEQLAMARKGNASITLQTFCAKSYASSPRIGLAYKFWKQGDSVMIKVTKFIKAHSLYNDVGQHAIWTLTNKHNLSSIYSLAQADVSKDLARLVSSLTGRRLPGFHTTHKPLNDDPGHIVYDRNVDKYYVEMTWTSPKPRNMHVTVYKENWEVLREERSEVITMNNHKTIVELDPQKLEKGKYYVQLRDDDHIVYQREEVDIE